MTEQLTVEIVEKICHVYAQEQLSRSEPIPSFQQRYPNKLESALSAPQRAFEGRFLYPTLEEQAAVLFYEMVKQHPFVNGNKRLALVSLLVFLMLNHKWLMAPHEQIYELALSVARSDARKSSQEIERIRSFILAHEVDEK